MAKTYTFSRADNNYFNGHDLHIADRENGRTITVNRKSGMLAVDVKDRTVRQGWPKPVQDAADKLKAGKLDAIYEGIRAAFWNWAVEDLAPEHGFNTAYSEGQSGGWLAVEGTKLSEDVELSETPEPDSDFARFLEVAFAAVEAVESYRKDFFARVIEAANEGTFTCPNCNFKGDGDEITSAEHVDSGCVLGALIGVVRDRGSDIDAAKIEGIDSDTLWNQLGPLADEIEEMVKPAPVAASKEA